MKYFYASKIALLTLLISTHVCTTDSFRPQYGYFKLVDEPISELQLVTFNTVRACANITVSEDGHTIGGLDNGVYFVSFFSNSFIGYHDDNGVGRVAAYQDMEAWIYAKGVAKQRSQAKTTNTAIIEVDGSRPLSMALIPLSNEADVYVVLQNATFSIFKIANLE